MPGLHTLEVVIGIVFVYLLLSLLAATINELVLSIFNLRGRYLHKAISIMLDDNNSGNLSGEFFALPMIFRFAKKGKKGRPSYLTKNNFSRALLHLLKQKSPGVDIHVGKHLKEAVQRIKDTETRELLLAFLEDVDHDYEKFRSAIETWYDEMMDRASGWYKRVVQRYLIVLGFILAAIFNADTFQVTRVLNNDPRALSEVIRMAEEFQGHTATHPDTSNQSFEELTVALDTLLKQQVEPLQTTLGMGWGTGVKENWRTGKLREILLQITGWLLTAFAISLGAPFWFDILNKVMQLRNAGTRPKDKKPVPGVATSGAVDRQAALHRGNAGDPERMKDVQ